jgi:hypothetical protein
MALIWDFVYQCTQPRRLRVFIPVWSSLTGSEPELPADKPIRHPAFKMNAVPLHIIIE